MSDNQGTRGIPQQIAEEIDSAFKKTVKFVMYKYELDSEEAKDIASKSLQYALRPALFSGKPWPKDGNMLTGMTINIAKLRAIDYIRHTECHPPAVSTDDLSYGAEEEEVEEHYALVNTAIERWREDEYKAERQELGAYALAHLPEIFEEGGVSARDQDVFSNVYLDFGDVSEVSEKYHITAGNVYAIICRSKKVLQDVGPRYLSDVMHPNDQL